MGRPAEPHRREELLEAVIDWLCEHGIGALSLRPLAADLGVSTFGLTYHFGSKDGLLVAALERVDAEHRVTVDAWTAAEPDRPAGDLFSMYWAWVSEPSRRARVRLALEAMTRQRTEGGPPGRTRVRLVDDWVDYLAPHVTGGRAEATLLNATIVGLLVDLVAVGPTKRLRDAVVLLADQLNRLGPAAPAPSPARRATPAR